ncbi:MAG: hypothetical protein JXR65_01795 [Bacteroidales bacterium]|nr:hypothetical protein [Bacteroidales bacterium]
MEPVTWVFAFPTNDGKHLVNDHFGEADYFDIYQINKEKVRFFKRIQNKSPEEQGHGDPNKAKNIGAILKKENVHVMVSLKYGANIFRMLNQFSCAKVHDNDIVLLAMKIQEQLDLVEKNWNMGENRKMLQFVEG